MQSNNLPEPKSLFVKILQWFYLFAGFLVLPLPFLYERYASTIGLPSLLAWVAVGAIFFYCLILFLSFLTRNNTLLIISLVFIFITTIGGLVPFVVAFPNIGNLFNNGLPECAQSISTCGMQDGIIVASAAGLAVGIPLLILNILTITGAIKALASTD